jgi:CO dehydrogenase/acetyl-CoA synthase delta subunit
MSEFRQITDAEELEGKTIARVKFDEWHYDNSEVLIVFTDESYVILMTDVNYEHEIRIEIDESEPELPYKIKHAIANPAEIAKHEQREERASQQRQELHERHERAEFERLKAKFEAETNARETHVAPATGTSEPPAP